jgi:hypothetical protein
MSPVHGRTLDRYEDVWSRVDPTSGANYRDPLGAPTLHPQSPRVVSPESSTLSESFGVRMSPEIAACRCDRTKGMRVKAYIGRLKGGILPGCNLHNHPR